MKPTAAALARSTRRYVRETRNFVDELSCYPRPRRFLEWSGLMILSKSIVVGESICVLVARGHDEEAFGLSRTLVDLFLTIRYITNKDSERRARRFYKFFAKEHANWDRVVVKYYQNTAFRQLPIHRRLMRWSYSYRSPHAWTGKGGQARTMAFERRKRGFSLEPEIAEFDYEGIYRWTSHYVHPTIVALGSHLITPGARFESTREKGGVSTTRR